jgi:hypothetical protein
MENTARADTGRVAIRRGALLIEKVHSCGECPIRRLAAERPHSVFARLHAWHKSWWPGWEAHQSRVCALATGGAARS